MAMLALFGFAGCDRKGLDMYGTPTPEYGVPSVDFILKGAVTDKDENSLEDIQVKLIKRVVIDGNGQEHIFYQAGSTNEDGLFKLQGSFPYLPESSTIHFIDENGVFAEKTKEFGWEDAEETRPPSGSWFGGEFTKTLPAVQLTPKADEENDNEEEAN